MCCTRLPSVLPHVILPSFLPLSLFDHNRDPEGPELICNTVQVIDSYTLSKSIFWLEKGGIILLKEKVIFRAKREKKWKQDKLQIDQFFYFVLLTYEDLCSSKKKKKNLWGLVKIGLFILNSLIINFFEKFLNYNWQNIVSDKK